MIDGQYLTHGAQILTAIIDVPPLSVLGVVIVGKWCFS
jgi:hypothetical protein